MAKLITRTFIGTDVDLQGVTCDAQNNLTIDADVYHISGELTKAEAQKIVDKNYHGKLIHPFVTKVRKVEELRGITPEAFYSNSILLDPVTRKPINAPNTEDIEIETTEA